MKAYWLHFVLLSIISGVATAADYGHFTVFGQAGYSDVVGDGVISDDDKQSPISADFLYTIKYKRASLLAEYFAGEDRKELERFELGLQLNSLASLKLGLLHNPAEYWLNEFHKGSYPRTSITNPFQSLQGFLGGGTSKRLSGAQLGIELPTPNDGRLMFDYTYAASPDLSATFSDVDIDDVFSTSSDNTLTISRLRYQPWSMNDTSFGISYGDAMLGIDQRDLSQFGALPFMDLIATAKLSQVTLNMYANIELGAWRLIVSHLNERLDGGSPVGPLPFPLPPADGTDLDFDLNYVHLERTVGNSFTVFARREKADLQKTLSPIVGLVADLIDFDLKYEKNLVGGRWDLAERQALTLQYSDHESFGQKQNMVHLSWSFVWDVNL